MNKAFTKEDDGAGDALPDREIPPHPNFVTAEGLAQIDKAIHDLGAAMDKARAGDDRPLVASLARDLRYWTHRRASAQLIDPPTDNREVKFGSRVTIERDDGRRQTFRIVGLDEADPAKGSLSYVSPMAKALLGRAKGGVVRVNNADLEIVAIA